MKNKNIQILFFVLYLCFGCKDDIEREIIDLNMLKNSNLSTNASTFPHIFFGMQESVPLDNNINKTALEFYKDFEIAVFASKSNRINFPMEFYLMQWFNPILKNPFIEELSDIDIVDSLGFIKSFFYMSEYQQKVFFRQLGTFSSKTNW